MSHSLDTVNEIHVAAAFDNQSEGFDAAYAQNLIIQYKRKRVRDHVETLLKPKSQILELNAGTGDDSIFFAQRGHRIHATDISTGMQARLSKKIRSHQVDDKVTHEICSFSNLQNLNRPGPYDFIFSNFAGLNCTGDLDKVLRSFKPLLKNDGIVTLVLLPKYCLWETLLIFRGKFQTAFRRFFSSHGRKAHIEGEYFMCWYYNPSYIIKKLKNNFDLLS